jgi:hypothetical protein
MTWFSRSIFDLISTLVFILDKETGLLEGTSFHTSNHGGTGVDKKSLYQTHTFQTWKSTYLETNLKKISYNRQGPRYSNGLKQTAVILNRQLPLITKIPHPYIIENTQPYMVEKEKHTCIHPHKWQTYDDINMRVGNHLGRIKRKQKAS